MADRPGIARGYAVRDGTVACDEAARNTGRTVKVATGRGADGAGWDAAPAETTPHMRRGVDGMKAAATNTASMNAAATTTKTASGMKATATVKTTTTVEATAATTVETTATTTVETTAATTVEAATPATVKAAAATSAAGRLG
jgi:hypothetical protein